MAPSTKLPRRGAFPRPGYGCLCSRSSDQSSDRGTADKVKPCFLARVAAVRASAIICVIFSSGRADQAFGGAWRGSEACVLAVVRRVYPASSQGEPEILT